MEGLVWKVMRYFPIVAGKIFRIKDGVITIGLNSQHGIRQNMKLILFRELEKFTDEETGEEFQDQEILGEARITMVGGAKRTSKAALLQPEIANKLKKNDKVITK